MEYLNGPSLKDELASTGPFELDRVRRFVPPLCSALQLAHDRKIFHRDLKPANLVSHRYDSGEIVYKIIDFGLAGIRESAGAVELTQAGHFLGSLTYASPEQLQGEALDWRTDIYSLGVVVYELLTGRPPFEGPGAIALLAQHLREPAPAPSTIRRDLPPGVDEVLLRALAKNPAERWPGAVEFARALGSALDTAPVPRTGPKSGGPIVFAKYEVGAPITRGRLGSQVFEGKHRALDLPVAIRVLQCRDRKNWEAVRSRFLTEARALQVPHPSIIQVRDFGEENDMVYVVTDLIPGCSLRDYLDRCGALPWPTTVRFVEQITDAASAVHRRGALLCGMNPEIMRVTRDERGERVMVSSGGITQVQDLLSTASEGTLRGRELADRELSYIAPELLLGSPADARSDIYTIGVLAYEMATGRLPFPGRSLPELLGLVFQGQPADPREHRPDIPVIAAAFMLKALRRDPAERFTSAAEMRSAWMACIA
jgi:serine/threonine protein kinase